MRASIISSGLAAALVALSSMSMTATAMPLNARSQADDVAAHLLQSRADFAAATTASNSSSSSTDALERRAMPQSLRDCLETYPFETSYPSSSSYKNYDISENENLSYKPSVFMLPSSANGAADAVKCYANSNQKLTVRGGGHSYAGYSLGGQDGLGVLDLRKFNSITVDAANSRATVGAGVRLGSLAQTLARQGFALPHGTCAMVGVSGHSLGGGYGYASRPWGYLADHVVEMQVVLPDGRIVTANANSEPDLFWALRGGGQANLGAVLSFTYALEKAPKATVDFNYAYKSNKDCVNVLLALQQLASSSDPSKALPKEISAELLWISEAAANGGSACTLGGQHINANRQQHNAAFQKLRDITKQSGTDIDSQASQVRFHDTWEAALGDSIVMAGFDTSDVTGNHEPYYAKSLIQPYDAQFDRGSATALMNKLNSYAGADGTGSSISFAAMGPLSQTNAPAQDANAIAHRRTLFLYQFYSYGDATATVKQNYADLVKQAKSIKPNAAWGAYVNYIDRELSTWANDYYGSALARLKSLKQKYDPKNVFDYAQGLAHA